MLAARHDDDDDDDIHIFVHTYKTCQMSQTIRSYKSCYREQRKVE